MTRRSTGLDYSSLFDEDYLYFYKPRLEEVTDADAEMIWRLLQLERVVERDGDFSIDRSHFDPKTGRATTERMLVRHGRVRRFSFSVRMFIAVELRDWLLDAGFAAVDFYDSEGASLTVHGRRMITIARR